MRTNKEFAHFISKEVKEQQQLDEKWDIKAKKVKNIFNEIDEQGLFPSILQGFKNIKDQEK